MLAGTVRLHIFLTLKTEFITGNRSPFLSFISSYIPGSGFAYILYTYTIHVCMYVCIIILIITVFRPFI